MSNLSAEWVLESRRRDRETQARLLVHAHDEDLASSGSGSSPGPRRRAAMFVRFPVDLLSSLVAVLLLVLIGRFS